MKTLNEMRSLVENGKAELLTVEKARGLKGQNIQTIYFGYDGQDGTDSFRVGDIISELEYYKNLKEDGFPDKNGNKNRVEYWESYMTKEELDRERNKLLLLREDGSNTNIFVESHDTVFSCSDENRYVSYIIL